MARKTIVELVDDTDGSTAQETVAFALDGISYEIDLNEEHAQSLRDTFESWTSKAKRVGGRRTRGTGSGASGAGADPETPKIRQWALENGKDVSDRGRISASLREEYYAAVGK